jgi:hypothetical protein
VTRQAEGAGTSAVLKEPAGQTLEVIPPLERLHATEHAMPINQRTIALGTDRRGRRDVRSIGDERRSGRSSPSFAGLARLLTHTAEGEQPSRQIATEKARAGSGRGVRSLHVEVSTAAESHDKVRTSSDLPVSSDVHPSRRGKEGERYCFTPSVNGACVTGVAIRRSTKR